MASVATLDIIDPRSPHIQDEADLLAAMGDPVRLSIILALGIAERNVTQLCGLVGKRQQAVSHHLTILKLRGLACLDRRGKANYYRLTDEGREALKRTSLA